MSEQDDIYSVENMTARFDNGEVAAALNTGLAKRQNLSAEDIEMLKDTHVMRALIFQAMERSDDVATLKSFAAMFERLEYLQQELWKFGKDKNFHRWFEVPKCSCPVLDNLDRIGHEDNVINLSCIIHGDKNV